MKRYLRQQTKEYLTHRYNTNNFYVRDSCLYAPFGWYDTLHIQTARPIAQPTITSASSHPHPSVPALHLTPHHPNLPKTQSHHLNTSQPHHLTQTPKTQLTIHNQIPPINKPARPTTKQHQRPRQLLRHAHPAHRVSLIPHLPRVREPRALVQNGVHVARGDAVDADAVDGPLGGQAAGEVQKRGFGDVVGGLGLWVVDAVGGDR